VLSVKKVARLKSDGRYCDTGGVRGLYLQISNGAKSYLFIYERHGRRREMGLGSAAEVPLKEAREQALVARAQLRNNLDPIELRRAERNKQAQAMARALSFREASTKYFEANASGWSNPKHRQQFVNTLAQYVHPIIGNFDVAVIDTPDILRVLEQRVEVKRGWPAGRFWDVRAKTADRVRQRISSVLDWAVVRGHRPSGLPNPARWKGHLDQVLPAPSDIRKTENHRALPYARVPELMAKLASHQGIAARALAFTALCAARSGETLMARWNEIDLKQATWTVPAARMKAREKHVVPLSSAAIELLKSLPREGGEDGLVFIGTREGMPLSATGMGSLLNQLGYGEIATPHGLRSSFRDWAAEQTNYPREVAEHALAHAVGSESDRAYARSKLFGKRRLLMQAWGKFCCTPPAKERGKVVPLRKVTA